MNYKDPEVLKWVNQIRASDGRKPLKRIAYAQRNPDGEMIRPANCHCPIAASIVDYKVTQYAYTHKATYAHNPLPIFVADWIYEFDYRKRNP